MAGSEPISSPSREARAALLDPPAAPRAPGRIARLNPLLARLGAVSPPLKRRLWRGWYDLLAARYRQADWTFMNYGYAAAGAAALPLAAADEANRYSIQLYEHVTRPVDLRGARVLEVGCGRGGGCAYLARCRQPAALLGIDFSAQAVAFCQRVHAVPGLTFRQGDAEALPCAAAAFDVVLNVESSHCYGSMPAFLAEVRRVLAPGGYFLWADIRADAGLAETRRQFAAAGFRECRECVITVPVLAALELASEQKRAMIRRLVPRVLAPCVEEFAGVSGTRVCESLRSGAAHYLSAALRQPGAAP